MTLNGFLAGEDSENYSEPQEINLKRKSHVCPCITAKIAAIKIFALLDTGAQMSAISEHVYEQLKGNEIIRVLPVTNTV